MRRVRIKPRNRIEEEQSDGQESNSGRSGARGRKRAGGKPKADNAQAGKGRFGAFEASADCHRGRRAGVQRFEGVDALLKLLESPLVAHAERSARRLPGRDYGARTAGEPVRMPVPQDRQTAAKAAAAAIGRRIATEFEEIKKAAKTRDERKRVIRARPTLRSAATVQSPGSMASLRAVSTAVPPARREPACIGNRAHGAQFRTRGHTAGRRRSGRTARNAVEASAEPPRTCTRSSAPSAAALALIAAAALRHSRRSRQRSRRATRLRGRARRCRRKDRRPASPSKVPSRLASIENRVSRTRSAVGRVASPGGAEGPPTPFAGDDPHLRSVRNCASACGRLRRPRRDRARADRTGHSRCGSGARPAGRDVRARGAPRGSCLRSGSSGSSNCARCGARDWRRSSRSACRRW